MEAADEEKYSNYFKSYSSAFELKTEDYRKQRKTSADDECSDFKNDHLVPKLSKCTIKCAYSDPFNIHERNSYLSPYLEAESALLFAPTRTQSVSEPVPFEKVAASGTDLLQIANKKSTNASKQFRLQNQVKNLVPSLKWKLTLKISGSAARIKQQQII